MLPILLSASESTISEVTVFTDRAQVTRTLSQELTKGEHTILFENLPRNIEQNSIQVNGSGDAVLKDIKLKTEHFAEIPDEDKKALFDEKQLLEDKITELDNTVFQIEKEKKFIEAIANRLTSINEKSESAELDPEKWIKMVEFYRSKLEILDAEKLETIKSKRTIQNKLDKINTEINEIGRFKNKTKKQVEVKVLMTKEGNLKLNLSYIVYGPTWYPVYDLRVSTDNKTMNITYNAMIKQNTSEDWKNVQINLSTAKLNIGGQPPKLNPMFISESDYSRSTPKALNEELLLRGSRSNEVAFSIDGMSVSDPVQNQKTLSFNTASVSSSTTSTVFEITEKNTILSDNQPAKVTIMIEDFLTGFRYSTVPKLSPYTYLKAKVKNDTDYPFLAGETNVFLNNNFVAKSHLKLVSPSEEFWTFLGIDEGMKVDFKLLNKFHEKEGVFSKKNKITFEYLIKITNNKKTQEQIVVWDQIPISQNEDIVVELLTPEYKEDTEILKMTEQNYIEWYFNPEPGEEIEIPFKYSIEYPKNMIIHGIE